MGANKNIKPSIIKNAEDKFNPEMINRKRCLKIISKGINRIKNKTDNVESKKLKLIKENADDELLKSNLK
jgi:hypothetical protein